MNFKQEYEYVTITNSRNPIDVVFINKYPKMGSYPIAYLQMIDGTIAINTDYGWSRDDYGVSYRDSTQAEIEWFERLIKEVGRNFRIPGFKRPENVLLIYPYGNWIVMAL